MPRTPSTIDRPLRMRARPEVVASAVQRAGSGGWIVSDPLTREHFELGDEEHALLAWITTDTSLHELQQKFERRFAPRRVDTSELWALLSRLHSDGLIVADSSGQGDELWQRDQKNRRDRWRWAWTRLLAIRLPSVDPDAALTTLHGMCRGLFSLSGMVVAVLLIVAGLATACTNARQLAAELPDLATLADPYSLLWLACVAVVIKVFHELGHALVCKQMGGEVREMGVLLLAFAPCLYCDVSSIWRVQSRWRRMAVTAAGMGVELLLAATAVIAWRFAEPGLIRVLAINVMIVCTVGTILVNANPLLRFDGYYLLSDLTGATNLWQRSRDAVRQRLTSTFTKQPSADSQSPRVRSAWLFVYGILSQAYVLMVLASITWLLLATLKPLGLASVAWGMITVCLATALVGPSRQLARWASDPGATARLHHGRATLAAVAVAGAVVGLLQMPWSYTVDAQAMLVRDRPQSLVATMDGQLVFARRPGDFVRKGEVVVRLANDAVEHETLQIKARVTEQQAYVDQLTARRSEAPQASDSLTVERTRLVELRRQLNNKLRDAERLVLRASRDGVVLSPANRNNDQDNTKLPTWAGSPIDLANRGAWIESGVLICQIGDPQQIAVHAFITEADIERLADGQPACVALSQTPGTVLAGKVTQIARDAITSTPNQPEVLLANWSPLQPPTARSSARYLVEVKLADRNVNLLAGGTGHLKIDTGQTTLGKWLSDGLRQTFRLPR